MSGSQQQSPLAHTWSSAIILSPSSSSSSSSFEKKAVTGGGDGAQVEAGSSVRHFVALVCGLGPASSLLAYKRFKPQMLAEDLSGINKKRDRIQWPLTAWPTGFLALHI
jgi:hypothetical protein